MTQALKAEICKLDREQRKEQQTLQKLKKINEARKRVQARLEAMGFELDADTRKQIEELDAEQAKLIEEAGQVCEQNDWAAAGETPTEVGEEGWPFWGRVKAWWNRTKSKFFRWLSEAPFLLRAAWFSVRSSAKIAWSTLKHVGRRIRKWGRSAWERADEDIDAGISRFEETFATQVDSVYHRARLGLASVKKSNHIVIKMVTKVYSGARDFFDDTVALAGVIVGKVIGCGMYLVILTAEGVAEFGATVHGAAVQELENLRQSRWPGLVKPAEQEVPAQPHYLVPCRPCIDVSTPAFADAC